MSDLRERAAREYEKRATEAERAGDTPAAPEERPARRRVPFHQFEGWIDRQIRQAQERGDFDNLPGKGKPLAPPDQNLAYAGDDALGLQLLKSNEALPAWIELNKEIAADQQTCRRILDYYVAERDPERRARFARDYRRRAAELNGKIDRYNLIVPARHLEKITRSIDGDLREADRRRWAAMDAADAAEGR